MLKRILSIITAAFLVFAGGALAGCKKKQAPNSESDLQISFWVSGFGEQYMRSIVAEFEKEYPQYAVNFEPTVDGFTFANNIELGGDYNTVDLYCTSVIDQPYDAFAEPLNDLLDDKAAEGESKTIAEKMIPEVLAGMKYPDGNYYGLSYSGALEGLVYNKKIIDGSKYKVPRTTQELEYLVMEMTGDSALKNVKPFIHYGEGGYWNRVYKTWQAQYDGLDDYYAEFLALKDGETSPALAAAKREDGRKAALDVLDRIINANTVMAGSGNLGYTQAQTMFMNGSAAMMANGTWLVNEMKSNSEATATDIEMMRTPVISSIRHRTQSIGSDEELRALIDAVDAASGGAETVPLSGVGKDGIAYEVTETDRDEIYKARMMTSTNYDGHAFIVPEYSNAKQAAKDFIRFCYSDAAIRIFMETTHAAMPVRLTEGSVSTEGWLDFEKSALKLGERAIPIMQEAVGYRSILFTKGGMRPYGKEDVITAMSGTNRKSAETLWENALTYFDSEWTTFLSNAGLQ